MAGLLVLSCAGPGAGHDDPSDSRCVLWFPVPAPGAAFHYWISSPLLPQVPRCCWSLPALCTMREETGVPVSVGRGWERSNLLLKNVRKAVNGLVRLKALSNHQFLLPLVFCPWDNSSLPDKLGKSNLCMRLQFDQVYWHSTFHTNVESVLSAFSDKLQ